jgi:hypothetical protein
MGNRREYEVAEAERTAREQGRTIPHYTGKVAKKLSKPAKGGKLTPPKRAAK